MALHTVTFSSDTGGIYVQVVQRFYPLLKDKNMDAATNLMDNDKIYIRTEFGNRNIVIYDKIKRG